MRRKLQRLATDGRFASNTDLLQSQRPGVIKKKVRSGRRVTMAADVLDMPDSPIVHPTTEELDAVEMQPVARQRRNKRAMSTPAGGYKGDLPKRGRGTTQQIHRNCTHRCAWCLLTCNLVDSLEVDDEFDPVLAAVKDAIEANVSVH